MHMHCTACYGLDVCCNTTELQHLGLHGVVSWDDSPCLLLASIQLVQCMLHGRRTESNILTILDYIDHTSEIESLMYVCLYIQILARGFLPGKQYFSIYGNRGCHVAKSG